MVEYEPRDLRIARPGLGPPILRGLCFGLPISLLLWSFVVWAIA